MKRIRTSGAKAAARHRLGAMSATLLVVVSAVGAPSAAAVDRLTSAGNGALPSFPVLDSIELEVGHDGRVYSLIDGHVYRHTDVGNFEAELDTPDADAFSFERVRMTYLLSDGALVRSDGNGNNVVLGNDGYSISTISVGADGSVYGLTSAGELIRWTRGRWRPTSAGATGWTDVSVGKAFNDVWLLDAAGKPHHFDGSATTAVTDTILTFAELEAARNGDLFGITTDGQLYLYMDDVWFNTYQDGSVGGVEDVLSPVVAVTANAHDDYWYYTKGGGLIRHFDYPSDPFPIRPNWDLDIEVSREGQLFVHNGRDVFTISEPGYMGGLWDWVDVPDSDFYGLSWNRSIYLLDHGSLIRADGRGNFVELGNDGFYIDTISVGDDGSVYGLTVEGDLIRWTRGRWREVATGMTGLTYVSVGRAWNDVWFLDANREPYYFDGTGVVDAAPTEMRFVKLEVATNGDLFGIDPQGWLYVFRDGVWKLGYGWRVNDVAATSHDDFWTWSNFNKTVSHEVS